MIFKGGGRSLPLDTFQTSIYGSVARKGSSESAYFILGGRGLVGQRVLYWEGNIPAIFNNQKANEVRKLGTIISSKLKITRLL